MEGRGSGPAQTPAGWYADPSTPGRQRYWDGSQWTEHTSGVHQTAPDVGGSSPADAATGPQGWGRTPRNLYAVIGVFAVLLVGSVIAAVVVSGSRSDEADRELADARAEIENERREAREEISSEQSALEAARSDAQDEIEDLRADAADARSDARREKKKLARLQDQVSGVQQQIEDNTIPGDGTFVVGEDIQPGTYKASAADGCYWARLSGLGGALDDIIANSNTSGPVTIEVAPSDKALEVSGCADFVKQGG